MNCQGESGILHDLADSQNGLFQGFREEFPEIGIRFTSNIWAEDEDREADLEICYGRGDWPDLKADCLTEDELFPVFSPELANGLPLPECPEQLSEHTLLHVIGYEEGWGYWFNQLDCEFRENSPGLQFGTLITALEMAKYGQGFALGQTSLVAGMTHPFFTRFQTRGRLANI